MFELFLIFIGIIIVVAVVVTISKHKQAGDLAKKIQIENPGCDVFVSPHDQSLIAVDFSNQKILLGKSAVQLPYYFHEIASSEVVQNGATVTTTNRGSQLVGAAVGGLMLGGIGAIVGGLSGSATSNSGIRRLVLRVVVDDPQHPIYEITFLEALYSKKGENPDGLVGRQAIEDANRFHALVTNAIRKAARVTQPVSTSLTDSIARLWELHVQGALTREEFEDHKQRLISG